MIKEFQFFRLESFYSIGIETFIVTVYRQNGRINTKFQLHATPRLFNVGI